MVVETLNEKSGKCNSFMQMLLCLLVVWIIILNFFLFWRNLQVNFVVYFNQFDKCINNVAGTAAL